MKLMYAIFAVSLAWLNTSDLHAQGKKFQTTFINAGDTLDVYGVYDSLIFKRQPPETVFVTDTVFLPPPSDTTGGGNIPTGTMAFGPSALDNASSPLPFSWTVLSTGTPKALYSNLLWMSDKNIKAKLNLPGGGHSPANPRLLTVMKGYKCPTTACLQFDSTKWRGFADAFNIKAAKDSVKKYRKFIDRIEIMDEPHVTGGGDGNTWGPSGTITKDRVDNLCKYMKSIFPDIPVGPSHPAEVFEPTKNYKICDFVTSQWSVRFGNRKTWADKAEAIALRQGTSQAYSINVINGGIQDKDGTWDCAQQGGFKGQREPNCEMTADTVKAALLFFANRTCGGMMMWRYDDVRVFPRLANTFKQVADSLKKLPYKPCKVR